MQNPPRHKKYLVRDKTKPWYKSPMLALGVTLTFLAIWFVFGIYVDSQLEIKPRLLILRSEGCAYLQLHHIPTQPYPIEHTCTAEVPFTYALFSQGGVIHSDELNLALSDSQIVAVEPLPYRPWTPDQQRLALWFCFSTFMMIGMMAWMFIAL